MLLRDDQEYDAHHGDAIPRLHEMPAACVDFSVYSPPFPSVYAYTSLGEDIGNSEDLRGEGKVHMGFFYRAMLRVMKPGRVMVIHVANIVRKKRSGEEGVFDFRGWNIRLAERAGFVFEFDWVVRKNPQAQAIRSRSWELKFQGLERDRATSRGALPDYLLKFRAPGRNTVPIVGGHEVSRNDWIAWAEVCWNDIRETDTLNVRAARSESDTRHICPLQLGVIDRLIRLYTNPGELVFSPFAGIGSEGYVALKRRRRFYGCELKDEYYVEMLRNLQRAIKQRDEEGRLLDICD